MFDVYWGVHVSAVGALVPLKHDPGTEVGEGGRAAAVQEVADAEFSCVFLCEWVLIVSERVWCQGLRHEAFVGRRKQCREVMLFQASWVALTLWKRVETTVLAAAMISVETLGCKSLHVRAQIASGDFVENAVQSVLNSRWCPQCLECCVDPARAAEVVVCTGLCSGEKNVGVLH